MKILHTSDLHGHLDLILNKKLDFDVWIDTGDFCPDSPFIKTSMDIRKLNFDHQSKWFPLYINEIIKFLNGRLFLHVPGNHDFIDIISIINQQGYENAHVINEYGMKIFDKYIIAGFPHINYIGNIFNYEAVPAQMMKIVKNTWNSKPDILATHSPPWCILDDNKFGIPYLKEYFDKEQHNIKLHLFGHVHKCNGFLKKNGVLYHNGAKGYALINL